MKRVLLPLARRMVTSPPRGVEETTARLRQLIDGIEAAVAQQDELALARLLLPPALGLVMSEAARVGREGGSWQPARSGLRWTRSRRRATAPGRFWLKLRFEDCSQAFFPEGAQRAPLEMHELDVELDTSRTPWRLCQAVRLSLADPER